MKWFAGVALLLLVALVCGLDLLAYAMYALLGVMVLSRVMSRNWVANLSATRDCNRFSVRVGDTVAVVITVENAGILPVVWEGRLPVPLPR